MEVGNALHKVMETIANSMRARQPLPAIPSLRSWVSELLPEDKYEYPEDQIEDIDSVLKWADRGVRYITHGNPTVLCVEQNNPRRWDDSGELGQVIIGAKADLVILRQGRAGRYVEIIDYKTGYSRKWTQFTPILSSIALNRRIVAEMPEQRQPRVKFSNLWFAHGEHDSINLTQERKNNDWTELKRILTRMVHEERWPMRPSPKVCKHCPYFDIECFPYPPTAAFTALDAPAERG